MCAQVEYRADTLRLNILELARTGNRLVTISGGSGRLVFACQDAIDAFETGMSGASVGGFTVDEVRSLLYTNTRYHGSK